MKSCTVFLLVFVNSLFALAHGQQTRQLERVKTISQSENRTALIIGNGSYVDVPLRNPVNDATDMSSVLKSLGFEVLFYTDLDQNGMKKAIREFGSKLRANGGVGLFYYAGHGVQVKGINYLIPVRAQVNSEEEVEYEGVEAGLVLAQMEAAKNEMNIVILDACRNNPFARSYRSAEKGLAQLNAPSGSLIAYSTAPGSIASDGTGRNGLYTQELLRQMKVPGVSIEEIFKQVRIAVRRLTSEKQTPWESSSLTGAFYFSGARDPGRPEAKTTSPEIAVDSSVEDEYWNNIQGRSDPKLFEGYLSEFPRGKYAALARQRISTYEARDETGTTATQYLNRGTDAFGKGRHDDALRDINRAISMAPDLAGAYFVRGNVYLFGRKAYVRAIADFDRCIELDASYTGCYNGRGVANHELKNYSKAVADFSVSIQLNPRWAPAYTFRASSYDKLGDSTKAAADRAKAKEIGEGRAGSIPQPSQATSQSPLPQVKKTIVQESMFTFELVKCIRSGTMVTCDLVITNNERIDKKLAVPFPDTKNGRTFDDQGTQSELDSWQIGTQSKREAVLISGVPVNAYVRFRKVSPQATVLKRIDLGFEQSFSAGGYYKRRNVVVRFSDIPLQ